MTPLDLIQFRVRMGWDRAELARQLDVSVSRLADYETGHTRGKNAQPVKIPKAVELACRYLGGEKAPLTPAERAALWRDTSALPRHPGPPLDDDDISREAIYGTRGR